MGWGKISPLYISPDAGTIERNAKLSEIFAWEGMLIPLPSDIDPKVIAERLLRLTSSANFTAFRWKRDGLYAGDAVGCVQIGKLRINILPKLNTPDLQRDKVFLLNILKKAGYLYSSYISDSQVQADSSDILEAMISEVAQEIIKGLKTGIPRRYEQELEHTNTLKGKIEFTLLSTQLRGTTKIPAKHFPLTNNNQLSSIIKGITLFLHRSTRSKKNRHQLSYALHILSHIENREITTRKIDNIKLLKSELHWSRTLSVGRLLLSGQSPDPTFSGENNAFSILFPMQHLYERALRNILTSALEKTEISISSRRHIKSLLVSADTHKKIIKLRPDYILGKAGIPLAIADAKWKRISELGGTNGVASEDFYQIYVYLKKYEVLNAFILAPRAPWMPENWSRTFLDTDSSARIHIIGIDLESMMSRKYNIRNPSRIALVNIFEPLFK